ncbi:hypothetical protein [Duganella phyllosphaerae]|uniref:Gluconate 2-dehydrogenase flavoprotein n=1 Tax=Duganella phyllosphaerae TaxID=762836 RepID=A0A1E7WKW4_9BURK|nr:hypothetical protein [Duganella phyllosphaerae]OEZ99673.1 gluconate 2-dehydrogenase flavoprotein precursor [Duganella phyllosphaerae]
MTAWKAIGFTGAYTDPYGVRMGTCNLCGFCEGFGCRAFKASPQTTILPILRGRANPAAATATGQP